MARLPFAYFFKMTFFVANPDCRLFGRKLAEIRNQAGISQSRLGMLAECNLSNLRLIEKDEIQAGVTTALRLLWPLNVDVCLFFDQLAEKSVALSAQRLCSFYTWPLPPLDSDSFAPDTNNLSIKAQFGQFFKQARTLCRVSQKTVAAAVHYHQRNLYNVEQRGQEPGIITATTMVAAIGYPVGYFFSQLNERIQKILTLNEMNDLWLNNNKHYQKRSKTYSDNTQQPSTL